MKDLDNLISLASSYKTIKEYLDAFVVDKDRFIAFYEKDFQESVTPADDGYLTLSTIHSAKGLQWKHVFIAGLYELNFPGIEKYKNKNTQKQEAYLNTKKKELYVACTRAAGDLRISFPASVNNHPQEASRLLAGIPISRFEPV